MLFHKVIGAGRPIVLLHGATLDHRHMAEVMEPAFEGRDGWQRIYVDLPGHGKSPAKDAIRSQDDVLATLSDFVNEMLGDAPFAVAGLSRGSSLARGLIYQRPEQITGAALIVAGGNPSSPHPPEPRRVILEDPALRATLPEGELWAFDNLTVMQTRELVERRRRVIAPANALQDTAQEGRIRQAIELSFTDAEQRQTFDGPSVILAGRQDWMCGYLDSVDIARRYTRATLGVLDGAGHALGLEAEAPFLALLRDWLDRLGQS